MADPTQTPDPNAPAPNAGDNQLDIQKQILKALQDQGKALENIAKLSKDLEEQAIRTNILAQEEKAALNERAKQLANATDAESKYLKLTLERKALEADIRISESKKIELTERLLPLKIKEKELAETGQKLSDEELDKKKKLEEVLEKEIGSLEDKKITLEEFNVKHRTELELIQRSRYAEQERANILRGIGQQLVTQLDTTLGLGNLFTDIAFQKLPVQLALLKTITSQAQRLFSEVIQGNRQFAATTGQIADRAVGFGAGYSKFGVGFKEMNEALTALTAGVNGFNKADKAAQEELSATAAKMKNLGVSLETTAKNVSILTNSFGMSVKAAGEYQNLIAKQAQAAGIPPQKMASDFASAMTQLASHGEKGIEVFWKLEKQARSMGMEINTLMDTFGSKFDQFETATDSVGRLNAILGGPYLDTIKLMKMEESDRVVEIRKQIELSNINISNLSRQERLMLANGLGMKNLTELNAYLAKSSSELSDSMNKQAASQKELEKAQKDAAEVNQKLSKAFDGLIVIVSPFVTLLSNMITNIAALNDLTGGWLVPLATGIAILWKLFTALSAAAKGVKLLDFAMSKMTGGRWVMLITLMALLVSSFWDLHDIIAVPKSPPLYLLIPMVANGIDMIGEAAGRHMEGLIALGVAMVLIGVAVHLAASGVAELVKSFAGLTGEQALAAFATVTVLMIGFAFAIAVLAKVSAVAAIPILGVGLALLMMGAGIAIAALGMAELVKSITTLATSLNAEMAANLVAVAGGRAHEPHEGAAVHSFAGGAARGAQHRGHRRQTE